MLAEELKGRRREEREYGGRDPLELTVELGRIRGATDLYRKSGLRLSVHLKPSPAPKARQAPSQAEHSSSTESPSRSS